MFYSNLPFVQHQSPIGEITVPGNLPLSKWMTSPADFQPAVVWEEDGVPLSVFQYGPNSKSTRYKMYNKGIVPRFSGASLMDVTTPDKMQEQVVKQVARGFYPPVDGVDMEAQAKQESYAREQFDVSGLVKQRQAQMQQLLAREN